MRLVNAGGRSDVLLVCEHASREIPPEFGDLGLDTEAATSHVAWDPGALAVATRLAERLDAVLIYQSVSRLLYDCNRPPESPGAVPETSEIYAIPGNQGLSGADRDERIRRFYRPFEARLTETIAARRAAGRATHVVTVHSFTPVYFGKRREVELGVLFDADRRLADQLLAAISAAPGAPALAVEENQPYGPADGVTHTLIAHGLANNLANVMLEIRNDLIADEESQLTMADRLADWIRSATIRLDEAA